MVEVTVKLPDAFGEVLSGIKGAVVVEALKVVAESRLPSLQKRLDELKEKIMGYESKYRKSYQEFSQCVPDTLEAHDDWIDWSYLHKLSNELSNKIKKMTFLIGK